MTTIATSLERCTLITMHERAPHTVPQADPLAVIPRPAAETPRIAAGGWVSDTRRSGRDVLARRADRCSAGLLQIPLGLDEAN